MVRKLAIGLDKRARGRATDGQAALEVLGQCYAAVFNSVGVTINAPLCSSARFRPSTVLS